jgi:hypothetical protein
VQAYHHISRIFRTAFRIARWSAVVIIGLAVVSLLLLQLPAVQNWLAQRVVAVLESRLQTKVELDNARVVFFNSVRLQGIYVEDEEGDTLLFSDDLKINFKMLELFQRRAVVRQVSATDGFVNLKRNTEGRFNFDFVAEAFADDTPSDPTAQSTWQVDLGAVNLTGMRARMDDRLAGQLMDVRMPMAFVDFKRLDMDRKRIHLRNLSLTGLRAEFVRSTGSATETGTGAESGDTSALSPWHILVDKLSIQADILDLRRADYASQTPQSIDFNDMSVSALSIVLDDLELNSGALTCTIREMAMQEKSGFTLQSLTGDLRFTPSSASITRFELRTPHSVLRDTLALKYKSLDAFSDFQNKVTLYFGSSASVFSTTDLAFLTPKSPYPAGQELSINGVITGKVSSLRGRDLILDYGEHTHFVGEIYTDGLPKIEETFIELNVETMTTTRAELAALIPNLLLPEEAAKLGRMRFSGSFQGFTNDFVAFGELHSALGYVKSDINMKISPTKVPSYSGNIALRNFHVGDWLDEDPVLGRITLAAQVSGTGVKENVTIQMTGKVDAVEFNNYTYRNIDVKGDVKKRFFDGQFYVHDPNLSMNFIGTVDFQDTLPVFDLTANVTHANLQALQMTQDYLAVKTLIKFDFAGNHPDNLNGSAVFLRPVIRTDETTYLMDTIKLVSRVGARDRKLTLQSEVLDATMSGVFQVQQIPVAVKQFVNKHYAVFPDTVEPTSPQQVHLEASIKSDHKLLAIAYRHLKSLAGTTITGDFASADNSLTLRGTMPEVELGPTVWSTTAFEVRTQGDAVVMNLSTAQAELPDNTVFTDVVFNSRLANREVTFALTAGNDKLINRVDINGRGETRGDSLLVSLRGSRIWLNGREWLMNGASQFVFDPRGMSIADLKPTNGDQQLTIYTSASRRNLHIDTRNVSIAEVLGTLDFKDYALSGQLNGGIVVRDYRKTDVMYIKGDLLAENVIFEGHSLGTVDFSGAYDMLMKTVNLDGVIEGDATSAVITGFYSLRGQHAVQLKADLKATPLELFQPFLEGIFSDMTGTITANFEIGGQPRELRMQGTGNLANGGLTVDYIGTRYTFESIPLVFKDHHVTIVNSPLLDQNGKRAELSGGLIVTRLDNVRFNNLRISSEPGFLLMRTTAADNPDFYGTVFGTVDLNLDGPLTAMDMPITLRTGAGTKMSLPVYGGSGYTRNRFVTFRTPEAVGHQYKAYSSPLELTMNIQATPDAEVAIIFDERAGDIIRSKGEGSLIMTVDRHGDMNLFGTYTILEGSYNFTMKDIVSKGFVLRRGSRIRFTGDPYEALMDITAVYETTAVPFDLLSDMQDRFTDEEIKRLKQAVPVEVLLYLGGTLENPTLRFGIEAPGTGTSSLSAFQTKLRELENDTTELNKQAFGLLVLKQFVPSSFSSEASGSGVDYGTTGFNTMTEFISNQLSRYFTDWLSKYNAQLDFNYSTYGTNDVTNEKSYSRSELDIELQKKLGRITVNVGGTFEFGAQRAGLPPANTFAGDFQLEYNLTQDGRIRLITFGRSDYDAFSSSPTGTVYKAGAGVFFRKDFDTWKEFLQRRRPK